MHWCFIHVYYLICLCVPKGILDEEQDDVLVNVNIEDDERAEKNIENKKKKPDYKPYDEPEYDEYGMVMLNLIPLSRGDCCEKCFLSFSHICRTKLHCCHLLAKMLALIYYGPNYKNNCFQNRFFFSFAK